MNNKHSSHPLICIDFKKNRIRIHRNTLRQIGNPEYIQLLVNPDQKMIGIKASCAEDKLAHKVKDYFVINGNSYELYSRELLYSLSQLNLSWEKFNIFRLEGNIYPDKKIWHHYMDPLLLFFRKTATHAIYLSLDLLQHLLRLQPHLLYNPSVLR